MSYATADDLFKHFSEGEVGGLSNRGFGEDDEVVGESLVFASNLIDGYLRERYAVPLPMPQPQLTGIACDIARYRLYQDQPTELVVLRYDQAIDWLKDVARGIVVLDIGVNEAVPSDITWSTPEPIFTRLVW